MGTSEPEKPLRLIEYLNDLVRLGSTVVYEVTNYGSVLWLSEIPKQKGCFTQAWSVSEEARETWVEIQKQPEPPIPDIPDTCEDWVNKETLYDSEELPALYSTIERVSEEVVEGETQIVTQALNLSDFPEVSSAWDAYLEEAWLPWMEKHHIWKGIHKVYTRLFEVHQQQLKLGEEYELVLGLGLLQWHLPNGHSVRRHLVVARARLDFEHRVGRFTVTADDEGAKLDLELDMLDEYQPLSAVEGIKSSFELAEDDPWDRTMTESVLSSLANLIGEGNGEYSADLTCDAAVTSKPKVYFAPALILRKRSVRGLEMVLDKIKELVQQKASVPQWFSDLCETPHKPAMAQGTGSYVDARGTPSDGALDDTTVYFPLPFNSQQLQIVEKWRSADGVLVQGPPGTGKSLTIANLICHLLAVGQRVLVTAKTPRALQVLHGLLPPEIGALCVNVLGSGAEERETVQRSIGLIQAKEAEWNATEAQTRIHDLERALALAKAEQAELQGQMRNLRERDTVHHSVINSTYSGTAAKIAARLAQQASEYGWFSDDVGDLKSPPVGANQLLAYRHELLFFTSDKKEELAYEHVDPSELPAPDGVRHFIAREATLQDELSQLSRVLDDRLAQIFESASEDTMQSLLASLDTLYAETKTVLNRPYGWIPTAVSEVLSDRDTPWKALQSVTKAKLAGLKSQAQANDGHQLVKPLTLSEAQLLSDCKRLQEYLHHGGSWRLWILKPRDVRGLRYIGEQVSFDGAKCDSTDVLAKVIEYLEVIGDVSYLWNLWQGKVETFHGPLFMQVAHLEEGLEALSACVALYARMESARAVIRTVAGLQEPAWHSLEQVQHLSRVCRAILSRAELTQIRTQLADMAFRLDAIAKKPRIHPFVAEAAQALRARDCILYSRLVNKAEDLRTLRARWKNLQAFERLAMEHFPHLANALKKDPEAPHWETRLSAFDRAYSWAQAKNWLGDYLGAANLASLRERLNDCANRADALLSQLAAEKAWQACLARMTAEQSVNLRLFSHIRIPKSGKTVLRKRREAQKYLNNARGAVPAWIMPLHRVYDTVIPSTDKFDVIIVDEASQCGQEALPLFFLGHKIIIVGDNKQISPMVVGVQDELIQQFVQRHLHDFRYKETFEPHKSLFDQAFYRFPSQQQIRLREHFRCMPEIIRFSNNLCYSDQPLIPLRRFSSQRLEPLRRVHVPSGFRQGTPATAINRPEAEAIVEAIVNCCADDAYQDKTMGVIVLQGHAQDRLIEEMLVKELDAQEIADRRLLCGTPYSFQGDERDVIFLSMVAAPNERMAALVSEDFVRRFNVAASRAKDQMWLFHSAELPDLGLTCLRRRLLAFFHERQASGNSMSGDGYPDLDDLRYKALNTDRSVVKAPWPFDSWFEVDVFLDLVNRGFRVWPQYPFDERRIDLVVEGSGGEQLAVECYGDYWHGPDEYEKDAARQRKLERSGWEFHIVRECEYRAAPAECIARLVMHLTARGIHPWCCETAPTAGAGAAAVCVTEPSSGARSGEPAEEESLTGYVGVCENIHQALQVKSSLLQAVIVEVMRLRPNGTCIKAKLHTYVLGSLGIVTRGAPREKFARKVDQAVARLVKKGILEIYKSKNDRLRLLVDDPSLF